MINCGFGRKRRSKHSGNTSQKIDGAEMQDFKDNCSFEAGQDDNHENDESLNQKIDGTQMQDFKDNCSFKAGQDDNHKNDESLNEHIDDVQCTHDAIGGHDKEFDMVIKNPDCDHDESKSGTVC